MSRRRRYGGNYLDSCALYFFASIFIGGFILRYWYIILPLAIITASTYFVIKQVQKDSKESTTITNKLDTESIKNKEQLDFKEDERAYIPLETTKIDYSLLGVLSWAEIIALVIYLSPRKELSNYEIINDNLLRHYSLTKNNFSIPQTVSKTLNTNSIIGVSEDYSQRYNNIFGKNLNGSWFISNIGIDLAKGAISKVSRKETMVNTLPYQNTSNELPLYIENKNMHTANTNSFSSRPCNICSGATVQTINNGVMGRRCIRCGQIF